MFPSNSGCINGGDDDEDFGDFVFSSPSLSHTPLFAYPVQTLYQDDAVDEGWSDFLSSPLESLSLQPSSSLPFSSPFGPFSSVSLRRSSTLEPSQLSGKGWEKHTGEIPLSFFGEEDVKEPKPLEQPGVFMNALASHSLLSLSSPRPASTGKLNHLLETLYDQALSGTDQNGDFDDGCWEFKGAFSASSGPKLVDEGGGDIVALENGASANGNGSNQIDVNRIGNGWKGTDQFKKNGQENMLGDLFASHEELTNRSLGHNYSVSDKLVHGILPFFGNGDLSFGSNGFKLEIQENPIRIRNGSTKNRRFKLTKQNPLKEKRNEYYYLGRGLLHHQARQFLGRADIAGSPQTTLHTAKKIFEDYMYQEAVKLAHIWRPPHR